jgi:hypothetical protein
MMQQGGLADVSPIPEICEQLERHEHGVRELVRSIIRDRGLPVITIADAADLAHQFSNATIVEHARDGYPTFPTPERGVGALRLLCDYHARRAEERS